MQQEMNEPSFRDLTPNDILGKNEGTITDAAKARSRFYQPQLTCKIIEEVKANSDYQRHQFAKNLVYSFFTLREFYNKIVNGKVSYRPHKKRMNMNKMDTVKCEAFNYFPCIASEKNINGLNVYVPLIRGTLMCFLYLTRNSIWIQLWDIYKILSLLVPDLISYLNLHLHPYFKQAAKAMASLYLGWLA